MKTQNNTQTKVNNRVTIVVLYISTVVFSLAVIGLTANAQELWSQYSTSPYGKMASVMVHYPSETTNADATFEAIDAEIAYRFNHLNTTLLNEPEMEETLEVENWMTDEANFISNAEFNALEAEEILKVEDWMIDETLFNSPVSLMAEETDEPLNVEEWMTSELNFNNQAALIVTGSEPEQALEAWMLNEDHFKAGQSFMAKISKQVSLRYAHKQVNRK